MIERLSNYGRYREMQLRNAWILAGMDNVLFPVLRGALLAFALILAYAVVSRNVEAASAAADQAAAVKLAKQAAYIANLEKTLAKCLTRGDNAIVIGGEIGFCGLTMTGVKAEQ